MSYAHSNKRGRAVEDDDDLEDGHAGSSLHAPHRKRSRGPASSDRDGSVISDEDSDLEGRSLNNDTLGDMEEAESSDPDADDDDVNEIRATQFIQKSRRQHANNIAAEQGIIEEVYCRNFMCHTKLRIRLGPLINFIIGHNGSGKSAVLTALTMCLGGKATATNRGASLKSLIKEGQESAVLAVKIKNQGDNAYKPELYGESITVERHFSRSGTSGFKIKNADDKLITNRKADLDDILDFFAFQLDNPINVLTQDMARQFLSNSTAAEKYKFFIRGTQLETLNGDYKLIEEHQNNMEEKLALRVDDVKILAQKAKEAEAQKKRLDASQSIMDKMTKTERMHAWAQVEQQEQLLRDWEEKVEITQQSIREKEAIAEGAAGTYEGHNQSYESATATLATLQSPLAEKQASLVQAKQSFDSNKEELINVQAEKRTIRDSIKQQKETVRRLEKEISQEQARLADAEGTAHVERLAQLDELKLVAEHAKQKHLEHEQRRAALESNQVECVARGKDVESRYQQATEDLNHARQRLSNLARDQGKKFAGYPNGTEQIVRDIDRETRWRSKPVGPFGNHVKSVKPEWSSVIETTLGGSLNAFAVTNQEDHRLLSAIIKRHNSLSPIFTGNSQAIDTRSNEPDGNVDTIMRVLRIDNDLVRNTLIINHAIEQTVLIKDTNTATSYMYDSGQRQFVRATIAMTAQPGHGVRFEYSRGGQKASPVRAWAGAARLQVDREDQRRLQQERVESAQREWDLQETERRRCQMEKKQAGEALVRWKRQSQDLRTDAQRAEDEVEGKKAEIEQNQPQDGRLQELERQLDLAKEEVQSTSASFEDSEVAKIRLDQIAAERKVLVDEAQSALDEAEKQVEKATKRMRKLGEDRMRALLAKNEAFAAIESSKDLLNRAEAERDKQQSEVDEFLRQASAICPRVPVDPGMTPEAFEKRLERLTEDLHRVEREAGGTREELTRKWVQAKRAYSQAKKELHDMKRLERALKLTLNERQRRWTLFRKFISVRAKINFHYLLSERSFRGRVILDHSSKLLDISVEPDISKNSDAGRQAKTLSGGEKSFSTICLLLSIWEAIGSPIRCLDEFDVFMDSVNRSTSMTMMIQAARRAVGKQFVLITPQAMNNVEMGDDVRVHRMSDPERGQTALSFAA